MLLLLQGKMVLNRRGLLSIVVLTIACCKV
jgi:hypothetical protein